MNWTEVVEDKCLRDLPYKIELNSFGQIVMSPAKAKQSIYQSNIHILLNHKKPGYSIVECPVHTGDDVKVPDVVWISQERFQKVQDEDVFSIAPEVCVEVKSATNTWIEMEHKKRLYFENGAIEVWVCDSEQKGEMKFFDPNSEIRKSKLFPEFPVFIEI